MKQLPGAAPEPAGDVRLVLSTATERPAARASSIRRRCRRAGLRLLGKRSLLTRR